MTVCRDKKIETSLYALNQTGHRVAVYNVTKWPYSKAHACSKSNEYSFVCSGKQKKNEQKKETKTDGREGPT